MAVTFAQAKRCPFIERAIVLDEKTISHLLSINTRNRPISRGRVLCYSEMMSNGRWVFENPTSMTFMVNESMTWLMDGQTRLMAMIKAGVYDKIGTLCIIPDEIAVDVFRTIDAGRARTSGNTLGALGIRNANKVAAMARTLIVFLESKYLTDSTLVNSFVNDALSVLEAIPVAVCHIASRKPAPAGITAGILNSVRLRLLTLGGAAEFLSEALADKGEEWSPEKYLSRYIVGVQSSGAHTFDNAKMIGQVTEMCRARAEGRKVKLIRDEQKYRDFARTEEPSIWSLITLARDISTKQEAAQ